jgi:hypothetical protein
MKAKVITIKQLSDAIYNAGWRVIDADSIKNEDQQVRVFRTPTGAWNIQSLATGKTLPEDFEMVLDAIVFCENMYAIFLYELEKAAYTSSINN